MCYTKIANHFLDNLKDISCIICRGSIAKNEGILLHCQHIFHEQCWQMWSQSRRNRHAKCVLCQQPCSLLSNGMITPIVDDTPILGQRGQIIEHNEVLQVPRELRDTDWEQMLNRSRLFGVCSSRIAGE